MNSNQATQFRIWATQVLKEHLIRGYTTYDKRLSERGIGELQQTVELLQKTLINHELVNDLGQEAIQIILSYELTYQAALSAIESLKKAVLCFYFISNHNLYRLSSMKTV
ncbi:RhuM family protein [Legionella israelensis]|uniref:Virulence protein n=1 Tax=Legionella israelensis TaxID=454 RepID=A0A0W0W6A5_9GAMM|nr:RhuM family protein [Legionella israelensis]KTD27865.1 hypothetical protein Lisr_0961 [Legionella israelensis]SCY54688.1 Virulence protein RhuM family protein [Legionella israelensis DSM 19235]STX59271.1 Virulence protein [Legionella israelensis]